MQPKKILGNRIFVTPYDPELEDSKIIRPESAKDTFPNWYRIQRTGEDVTGYEKNDIVLLSPQVVKRQGLIFEFEDGVKEIMMKESNILGTA